MNITFVILLVDLEQLIINIDGELPNLSFFAVLAVYIKLIFVACIFPYIGKLKILILRDAHCYRFIDIAGRI